MEPLFQQDRPAMKKPPKQQTPSLKAVLGATNEMMRDSGEPSLRTGVQEGGAERNRAPPGPGFPLHGAWDVCSPPVVLRRPLWHRGMCVS